MKKMLATVALAALLVAPSHAAALTFSEVMYDPDGTDSGREWVEVFNEGAEPVDLALVALVEGGTRHKVAGYQGGATTLAPGGYAVITDRPELFLADYPGVSPVLDSAFSLANDGETLTLSLAASSPDLDTVSWTSDAAATGGKSWQRAGTAWIAAGATPGAENALAEEVATSTDGGGSSGSGVSAHAETPGLSTYSPAPTLKVSAGRARLVAPRVEFRIEPTASASGRISFRWSWGDGASSRGRVGRHSYRFPGRYAVVLYAASGNGAVAISRTTVTVVEPSLSLEAAAGEEGYVALRNGGAGEVNLGSFLLQSGRQSFAFPEDTILLASETVQVPAATLGLDLLSGEELSLRYPDGADAAPAVSIP